MSPSTRVEKLMSARGRGGIFCQKLTEADKGGGGVKIDQILADVICEPSLTVGTLSVFQEFFLQPIIKDRPNKVKNADPLLCEIYLSF